MGRSYGYVPSLIALLGPFFVLTGTDGEQVDCEMTGLDAQTDRLLEIAVIITDGRLRPVDEGIEFVIQTSKEVLDRYAHGIGGQGES